MKLIIDKSANKIRSLKASLELYLEVICFTEIFPFLTTADFFRDLFTRFLAIFYYSLSGLKAFSSARDPAWLIIFLIYCLPRSRSESSLI